MDKLKSRIKKRRKELGLSLAEVGRRLGVSESTVQRYESGLVKNIPLEYIERYAEILQCEPAYLMGWSDNPDPIESEEVRKLGEQIVLAKKMQEKGITEDNFERIMKIWDLIHEKH